MSDMEKMEAICDRYGHCTDSGRPLRGPIHGGNERIQHGGIQATVVTTGMVVSGGLDRSLCPYGNWIGNDLEKPSVPRAERKP